MRGFTTLYLPGCDHAGIATQVNNNNNNDNNVFSVMSYPRVRLLLRK
jgi:valyl-tRNA synthetase